MKFYGYAKCSTCQKAKKFLTGKKIKFEDIDITATPPSLTTLKAALSQGYTLRELFNTSGELYRAFNMKEKITKLSESELLKLLAENGKLVKRPFVSDGQKITVGFNESFEKTWK